MQYKADIEEHLGGGIPEVTPTFEVPVNEYDGKVTYGLKVRGQGFAAEYHVEQLASSVDQLASLEKKAQSSFIRMNTGGGRHWLT